MHNELRFQAKIHTISEKLSKEKIKILHLLPQFFFFLYLQKKQQQKPVMRKRNNI
jgi:hypothetical protein